MHEIKFRVEDEDGKVVGYEWLGNGYWKHQRVGGTAYYSLFLGNSYTRRQYIGKKDKNGVEIYEGDQISKEGAIVVWCEQRLCWCFVFDGDEIVTPLSHRIGKDEFEVIPRDKEVEK